jgi:Mlc titration factor MtfA (ptsG expression regulator)
MRHTAGMIPWLVFSGALVITALALWIPRARLKKAIQAPFPGEWAQLLENNIQVYRQLPTPLRLQLRKLIKQFLHQKHFSGAGGLEITDEIRLTIAAEACMLILNRSSGVYSRLRYIIVYPTSFVVERGNTDQAGVVEHQPRGLLGESWQNGKVILAWDSVLHGARNFLDGHNVVLHEFAHQLDSETGSANGAPLLGGASSYATWASVLSEEFEDLQANSSRGKRFQTLESYYRIDPRQWSAD